MSRNSPLVSPRRRHTKRHKRHKRRSKRRRRTKRCRSIKRRKKTRKGGRRAYPRQRRERWRTRDRTDEFGNPVRTERIPGSKLPPSVIAQTSYESKRKEKEEQHRRWTAALKKAEASGDTETAAKMRRNLGRTPVDPTGKGGGVLKSALMWLVRALSHIIPKGMQWRPSSG